MTEKNRQIHEQTTFLSKYELQILQLFFSFLTVTNLWISNFHIVCKLLVRNQKIARILTFFSIKTKFSSKSNSVRESNFHCRIFVPVYIIVWFPYCSLWIIGSKSIGNWQNSALHLHRKRSLAQEVTESVGAASKLRQHCVFVPVSFRSHAYARLRQPRN